MLDVGCFFRPPLAAPGALWHTVRMTSSPSPIEPLEARIAPATFLVTTTADAGAGSLRQAIDDANATTAADTIAFTIPGSGLRSIILASELPVITEPLTIDGTTQPGYVAGGAPLIELGGAGLPAGSDGLVVTAAASRISALTVNRFSGYGILLAGSGGVVDRSYIGTDATGQAAAGNGIGLGIKGAQNLIGGAEAGLGNVISGNVGDGVRFSDTAATGNFLWGNRIGLSADRTLFLPNAVGVYVESVADDNVIGGSSAALGNEIAGNTGAGVMLAGVTSGSNAVASNAIHSNGGLGIDRGDNGPTLNSADGHQNFPVLTEVLYGGGRTLIRGTLTMTTAPSTAFTVQFFANAVADASGFGEGQTFLGTAAVTTDSTGVAVFHASVPFEVLPTAFVTATAIDFPGNTSEFSPNHAAVSGARQPTIAADGRSATFTDADGDRVTVAVSRGRLDAADFTLVAAGAGAGAQLVALNFSDDGAEFAGANVSISAKRTTTGGDGFVNLGYLNGTGVNLGVVKIRGDLGRIDAGAGTGTALVSLSVQSLGRYAGETDVAGASPDSRIAGHARSISVAGDLIGAALGVTGNLDALTVRRNVIGFDAAQPGLVLVEGILGRARIGGDLNGGDLASSGSVTAGLIRDIAIGGSLIGGAGASSGAVVVGTGGIGKVAIAGAMLGAAGNGSAAIDSGGGIGSAKIGGGTRGGDGVYSAAILAGGRIGSVSLQGSLLTPIASNLTIGSVTISGDHFGVIAARGMTAPATSAAALAIGKVSVAGNLSGAIFAGWDYLAGWVNPDVTIGTIFVGGNAGTIRISAGVEPGANNTFADNDDRAVSGGGSVAITSRIASIVIGGQVGRSELGSHLGFTAQQIGRLQIGGLAYPLTAGVDRFDIGILGNVSLREA